MAPYSRPSPGRARERMAEKQVCRQSQGYSRGNARPIPSAAADQLTPEIRECRARFEAAKLQTGAPAFRGIQGD